MAPDQTSRPRTRITLPGDLADIESQPGALTRGLSVRQPWAWAIAQGWKPVENRTRAFPRALAGVPVALHASRVPDAAAVLPDLVADESLTDAALFNDPLLDLGAVIAVVTFTGSHQVCRTAVPPAECGAWAEPGCHHWTIATVRPLAKPVPCRGMPGFWPLPPGVAATVAGRRETA